LVGRERRGVWRKRSGMSESEEVGERGRKRECGCVEAVGTVKV